MLWNSDATQFTFGNVVTKRKACYLGDDDPNDATSFSTSKRPASLKVEPQNESAALQDTIIKIYLDIFASGCRGPGIYILADNRLHKNEVCPYLAKGLDIDHKKCNLTDMASV